MEVLGVGLEDWNRMVEMAAVVLGGFVAYYKFVKGKVFAPRLEPTVSGRIFENAGAVYLAIEVSIRNVGSSRVKLDRTATTVVVGRYDDRSSIGRVLVGSGSECPVFQGEGDLWVESGETLSQVVLVRTESGIYLVDLQVAALRGLRERTKNYWNVATYTKPTEKSNGERCTV